MVNKKLFAMFSMVLLFPFIAQAQYEVFYIPLDVETFTPVTVDEIESKAFAKYQLKESAELDAIYNSLEKVSKPISKSESNLHNVRAKFIRTTDNKSVYLDKERKLFTADSELNVDKDKVGTLIKSLTKKFDELCKSKKLGKDESVRNCTPSK